MNSRMLLVIVIAWVALAWGEASRASENMGGVTCHSVHRCDGEECSRETLGQRGNVTDILTSRNFFLDYPCDLKEGEDVVFILNIHGAGSIANWQRHYFPAIDYKDKYRLVVATSTAATMATFSGREGPGTRMWVSEADDEHLQNIVNFVVSKFGKENIRSFWLAGHSQGGGTSHRLVCTPFFRDKVDGLLSLSGGRIGEAPIVPAFGPPGPDGKPPAPRNFRRPPRPMPDCDFSHIYATGAHEIVELPDTSPWAEKYACDDRVKSEVVDSKPGWVEDSTRKGYPVWGMERRPGTAEVYEFPGCSDGRVVADVVRLDKGHTEGLEPAITERIIQLIVSARGEKIARGGALQRNK